MLSVTEENRTTRATSRIFAIIAAFPPPWEWPLTAICDHFGVSRSRNLSHPSSGYCRVRMGQVPAAGHTEVVADRSRNLSHPHATVSRRRMGQVPAAGHTEVVDA